MAQRLELLSGPEGGDAQIAALVATGAVDAVFFFFVLGEGAEEAA